MKISCETEGSPMIASTPAGRRAHIVVDSPVGPLTLVAAGGALAGLMMTGQRHAPGPETFGAPDPAPGPGALADAARQLAEYFAGDRTEFDLELALSGTPFQQRVWKELRAIGYGETISYGQLAERIGQPTAFRAVGLANGKNPVSIIVPCHRVIGSGGSLTGYGGGLERKQFLLALEQRVSGQTLA
jgi:methylated-DNA-[protein]-cysteine S-methyltransferase